MAPMPRLALLLPALVVAACTTTLPATPSPSPDPGTSPAAPTAGATGSPGDSPSVAPSPSVGEPFTPALTVPGTARVLVDLLSVRTRPAPGASQVDLFDGEGELVTDSLRLNTGALVQVLAGPLVNGGLAWYRVASADELDGGRWESGQGGPRAAQGWVAGGADGVAYLEAASGPGTCNVPQPEGYCALRRSVFTGSGSFVSPTVDPLAGVEWDAADQSGVGCRITVTLVPADGGAPQQIVTGSVGSAPQGASLLLTPQGGQAVRVDGDCAWTLAVLQPPS